MKRIIFMLPVLLIAIQGFAQFKANMDMSMDGNEINYLVYSAEDRYRYEFSQGGQEIVLIINPQAGKSFMLIPAQKIFMPMDQGNMRQQGNDPVKNYDQLRKSCTEKVDFYDSSKRCHIRIFIFSVLHCTGKNSVDQLISYRIDHRHFVFTFGCFSLIIPLQVGIISYGT